MIITNPQRLMRMAALGALFFASLASVKVNAYSQSKLPSFKPRNGAVDKAPTALSAWSIPSAAFSIPSPSFQGPRWYNELHPTARTTVYDDVPLEYTFVSPGSDWPSSSDFSHQTTEQHKPKRVNPLRRAAQWVARGRKNHSD